MERMARPQGENPPEAMATRATADDLPDSLYPVAGLLARSSNTRALDTNHADVILLTRELFLSKVPRSAE